jgi:hypothetical protein
MSYVIHFHKVQINFIMPFTFTEENKSKQYKASLKKVLVV